jgi:hypothetical protein
MRFDLDPPHGVGALRIGTSREEARKELEKLGQCRPFARYDSPPGWLVDRGRSGNGTTAIFAYCDPGGQVNAIEFGTPGFGTRAEDEIVYRDIDVFRSPASEVVAAIRRLGEIVEEEEAASSFVAPNVLLALWRDGGPRGPDGRPLYFESAFIARPGYKKNATATGI